MLVTHLHLFSLAAVGVESFTDASSPFFSLST